MNLTTQGLLRFVQAQDLIYESVCNELSLGEKTSHWMWFIFPQVKSLGHSPIAKHYGLESATEAQEFWDDPVLGPRLKKCTQLVLAQPNTTAHDIFGSPDDIKFKSCMTLFAQVVPNEPCFKEALTRFFNGNPDESTLKLLN